MTILRCYSNLNLQLWKAKLKLVLRNNWISLIRKGAVAFQSRIPSHCGKISPVMDGAKIIIKLLGDLARFLWLSLRPQCSLAAENLFLHKQLALFKERNAKPRRPDTPIRIALVLLSRLFHWRDALVIVQPQTRCSRVATYGTKVHTAASARESSRGSTLVELPSQSCFGHLGL
jgi:hypothetical protein